MEFFAATKASEGWTPFFHKKLQKREENLLEAISDTGQSVAITDCAPAAFSEMMASE